ncbi:MAG: cobalamin B12-binding domain-containing protein [Deltaproteobacteria bacterium]|nr:cobalamin B12-binding domain-containing protein [Deltaproteobacteria bacterium]
MSARRPRVLLVTPPYHAGVVESAGVWLPLGVVYVAGAARRAGAEVRIYDAMSLDHTHADIARAIEAWRPDVVAVYTITAMEPDAREVCRAAKRVDPRTLTVLGGVHPTFMWREVLEQEPAVDVAVRGEGEGTFAELVAARAAGAALERVAGIALRVDGRPVATPARPFVADLDALEPAWDLLDWPRYYYRPNPAGRFAIVSSSRGCLKQCAFCSQQKLWERTWRARTAEAFVGELELLRDVYGVRVAMLSDETPTVERPRWERILDLLAERKVGVELLMETRVDDVVRDEDLLERYVAAGVSHLYAGVESGSQATLDLFKKETQVAQSKRSIELINAAGIISETSFVLGMPEDTTESILATVELAKWYGPDMAFFLALAPWPYADLYPQLEAHVVTRDYRKYNLVEPVLKPRAMTVDEVRLALHQATGEFFRDKFQRLGELSAFKQEYLLRVLKLLIEHSYLGAEMKALAAHVEVPPAMRELLERAGVSLEF